MRLFTKRRAVLGSIIGVALTSAIAFAAWSVLVTGGDQFRSKAATTQNVSLTMEIPPADLVPGGSGVAQVRVGANENTGNVVVSAVNSPTITTSANGSCPGSNFTINSGAFVGKTIPATGQLWTVPNAISMAASAPDACKGVTVFYDGFTITAALGS